MATVAMDVSQPPALPAADDKSAAAKGRGAGKGLGRYYNQHIHDVALEFLQKTEDLHRQEAQRNVINSRGIKPPPVAPKP
jgi:26S proteasome regulatory subunit T6